MSDTDHPPTNPCGPPEEPPITRPSNERPEPTLREVLDRIEQLATAQAETLALQKAQGETIATMATRQEAQGGTLQHLSDRVLAQQGEHPPCEVGRAMAALRREREQELAKSNGGTPPVTPQ